MMDENQVYKKVDRNDAIFVMASTMPKKYFI